MQIQKVRIHPDCFLFNCFESDAARTQRDGSFQSHFRYEPFLFGHYIPAYEEGFVRFCSDLEAIVKHAWQTSPQFRRNEEIDLETIAWFSQAITTLFADIDSLFRFWTGSSLPSIPDQQIDADGNYGVIEDIIARFAAFDSDENPDKGKFLSFDDETELVQLGKSSIAINTAYATQVWAIVSGMISEIFGDYCEAILAYASWKYTSDNEEEKIAKIDWGKRPPVGELFNKYVKHLVFGGDRRGARFGGRSERGGRPERGERPERSGRFEQREPEDNGERFARKARLPDTISDSQNDEPKFTVAPKQMETKRAPLKTREEMPHYNREHAADRRDRSSERPRRFDRQERPKASSEDTERALAEARAAVEAFRKSKDLEMLPLAPVNSFLRREQHTILTDAGLGTESRGEGRDRHVCVVRLATEN